ncbi:trypsin-like serine peptidase [Streptomyces sp. NPDC017615]|uniref:trypsin-like serine peptidase n=1 Tax=unclassified Streptomyces TaxID=2593676 RepID=UPI001370076A|nr:trypsin-like peptidase domain-containing protein [Streptomyces sp. SID4982]MYS16482.1 trypsin-like serine protease [Streptomyces sp. SID4982]
MRRSSGNPVSSRPALLGAVVMLALTSASVAAADDGRGPLEVTVTASADARTARVGALFGADGAGRPEHGHFCTASVVHSPGRDLLVTAAHCLTHADGKLFFAPGYRNGRAPYGMWPVRGWVVPEGWAADRDEDSDVAFAHVAGLDGRRVEDVVGANRFTSGTVTGATAVTLVGQPDAREAPVMCTDRPAARGRTQQRVHCPGFTAGTSGSPWVNGAGQVVGVLGGHEQGGATADVSYSVVLGSRAAALYRTATGS